MKREGVGARNYVLHINRTYTVAPHGDHLYLEVTKAPYGDKTWCGRMAAAVNGASTGCGYSNDELCIACLGKATA